MLSPQEDLSELRVLVFVKYHLRFVCVCGGGVGRKVLEFFLSPKNRRYVHCMCAYEKFSYIISYESIVYEYSRLLFYE